MGHRTCHINRICVRRYFDAGWAELSGVVNTYYASHLPVILVKNGSVCEVGGREV